MTSMKIVYFSRPPLLSIYVQNFSTPWSGQSNFNQISPLPPKNYGTTAAECMWTNEINTKTKPSTSHSIVCLAHKQCNDIINGWLHFLAPESIGKFLVNNILVFNSAWILAIAQIQFCLIKRNTGWTSITLAVPDRPPLPLPSRRQIISHFCLKIPFLTFN